MLSVGEGFIPPGYIAAAAKLAGTHICVPYKPSGNLRRGGIYAARAVYGGENIHGGVKTPPYDTAITDGL